MLICDYSEEKLALSRKRIRTNKISRLIRLFVTIVVTSYWYIRKRNCQSTKVFYL